MTLPLITLDEANAQARERRAGIVAANAGIKNGIACPTCRAELADSRQPQWTLTLMGQPTYQHVFCSACGWYGQREV